MGEVENEALVRRAIDAWNADDWEAMEALCHRDITITAPRQWPETGDTEGWPGVRRQFERLKESWSEERIEPVEYRTAGDMVLVAGRWMGRAAASGLNLDLRTWVVYRIVHGAIRWMGFFLAEGEALGAAGLPPARKDDEDRGA